MRVGFDISQLAHSGGVVTYTNNLAHQLILEKDLEMIFFYSSLRRPFKGDLPNVKKFPFPPTLFEFLFNSCRLPKIEKLIGQIDIFHSSDWVQPPTDAKKVTTYHDLVPLLFPQWSTPNIVEVNKKRLKLVEKEVDMVITVSETTKADLMKISTIPSEKITVIYEGVDTSFKPQPKDLVEEFRKEHKLPDKFILAIGGVGQRRNLDRVKQASKDHPLVITRQTLKEITDTQMPLLYAAATVLLYPSFYEGFGLPIIEAMSVGTPVITSNLSSMPEVGGDGALYVDPKDLNGMISAINDIWDNQDRRDLLIKKGFAQAKKFSWDNCAHETAELYRRLMR